MCTQKMIALSYIEAEKITFPPKPDRKTYGWTDISVYRVASLLKIKSIRTTGALVNHFKFKTSTDIGHFHSCNHQK